MVSSLYIILSFHHTSYLRNTKIARSGKSPPPAQNQNSGAAHANAKKPSIPQITSRNEDYFMGTTYIEEIFGYNHHEVHHFPSHFLFLFNPYRRISATPKGDEKIIDSMIVKTIRRAISIQRNRNSICYPASKLTLTKSKVSLSGKIN